MISTVATALMRALLASMLVLGAAAAMVWLWAPGGLA